MHWCYSAAADVHRAADRTHDTVVKEWLCGSCANRCVSINAPVRCTHPTSFDSRYFGRISVSVMQCAVQTYRPEDRHELASTFTPLCVSSRTSCSTLCALQPATSMHVAMQPKTTSLSLFIATIPKTTQGKIKGRGTTVRVKPCLHVVWRGTPGSVACAVGLVSCKYHMV
jgi:hypothetical protein